MSFNEKKDLDLMFKHQDKQEKPAQLSEMVRSKQVQRRIRRGEEPEKQQTCNTPSKRQLEESNEAERLLLEEVSSGGQLSKQARKAPLSPALPTDKALKKAKKR